MIPQLLFQTSVHPPESYILEKIQRLTDGWKYLHFTDDDILTFFTDNYLEEFGDIIAKFHSMPTGAHKADLFRYYYLYLYGGVFMDSDAMIQVNLDDIAGEHDFFTVKSEYNTIIFQGFIGAIPQHPIIYHALKNAYDISTADLEDQYDLLCMNLYWIIDRHIPEYTVRLYKEIMYDDDICATVDDNNSILLLHYWRNKTIPTG
jgi:mannosyltransferase OCH1-like enzyme